MSLDNFGNRKTALDNDFEIKFDNLQDDFTEFSL